MNNQLCIFNILLVCMCVCVCVPLHMHVYHIPLHPDVDLAAMQTM